MVNMGAVILCFFVGMMVGIEKILQCTLVKAPVF